PHDVVWREADSARVRNILQNPAYAGAYVYGRRQRDPARCRPGPVRGTVKVAVTDWAVCLQAAHPGYISWEEFMANQRRLADNVNHQTDTIQRLTCGRALVLASPGYSCLSSEILSQMYYKLGLIY
ncbi:MAG: recombinase family protein, partial [Methylocystis silviterrae]|uniref:recombinase family protein n=1 Tax=Methylocystis silviterrae TaxID=2743612 RepID=UPI003C74D800